MGKLKTTENEHPKKKNNPDFFSHLPENILLGEKVASRNFLSTISLSFGLAEKGTGEKEKKKEKGRRQINLNRPTIYELPLEFVIMGTATINVQNLINNFSVI